MLSKAALASAAVAVLAVGGTGYGTGIGPWMTGGAPDSGMPHAAHDHSAHNAGAVDMAQAAPMNMHQHHMQMHQHDHAAHAMASAEQTAALEPVADTMTRAAADAGEPATKSAERKVLYYRNPMGLPDTSPVPKKDSMGMDYIAVYADEAQAGSGSGVKVSLDRVQRSGVRTEPAKMLSVSRPVTGPGIAKADDRTLRSVSLRADGFIEKLYVSELGKEVMAGQPLFRLYSQQMVNAQVDYRTAVTASGRTAREEEGAMQRLRNLDLPESVMAKLRASPDPIMEFDWPAPANGVIVEKKAVEGQMARMGDELYRIADLTSIWVITDVAEQDLDLVKMGAPAKVTFRALPGETFEGQVSFVLHTLDSATRTGKVRVEIKNPDLRIKYEMFADVAIETGAGEAPRLAVPSSAVLDSGSRQVVLVSRGEGKFDPRPVKIGRRGDGMTEILDGLSAGDDVVVSANFLIDAESNLQAALRPFTAEANQ